MCIARTRRARSAWRSGNSISVSSAATSTARRASGSVSAASSCSKTCARSASPASMTLSAARRVSTSTRLGAVAHLSQRGEQPPARVRQPRVERHGGQQREHLPAVVAARALLERALEVGERAVGGAALLRADRGAQQQLADRRVAPGCALEQVPGDAVGVGAGGHQRTRRLAVQPLALGARQARRDGAGDQAVGEALAVGRRAGRPPAAPRAPGRARRIRCRRPRRPRARARRRRRPPAPRPPRGRAARARPAAGAARCAPPR